MTSAVKSCSLDPVPTFIVGEFVDLLLPCLTNMVNASLAQGRLPLSQKHAIVTLLLTQSRRDLILLTYPISTPSRTFRSRQR